jgi:hypothetical protein
MASARVGCASRDRRSSNRRNKSLASTFVTAILFTLLADNVGYRNGKHVLAALSRKPMSRFGSTTQPATTVNGSSPLPTIAVAFSTASARNAATAGFQRLPVGLPAPSLLPPRLINQTAIELV